MADLPSDSFDLTCPWGDDLAAYLQGELPVERALDVSEHLEACGSCRSELAALRELVRDLVESDPVTASVAPTRDLSDRVLGAIAVVVLKPFRHLGPAGRAWVGMATASVLLLLLVRGPLTPEDALPRPVRPVAVAEAAAWLVSAQEEDGSWGPGRWGGRDRWRVGLSGLALSALVASEQDGAAVTRALDRGVAYLVREQAANGRFGSPSADHLYNHALATLALLRIVEDHPVPEIITSVARAVDYVAACQSSSGGWGYADFPETPNSLISAWPLESLLMARFLGRTDLDAAIGRARAWFTSLRDATGRYGYDRRGAFPHGPRTSTAVAVAVGAAPGTPWPDQGRDDLDLVGVYFLSGNLADDGACDRLRRRIAAHQVRSGAHVGSFRSSDRWAADGGRLYATALSILAWTRL